MSSNFSNLWSMCWSWLFSLLNFNLPIYMGGVSLSTLDIIIGTVGIFAAFGTVRALIKSGFTIAGKDLKADMAHQSKIRALNQQTTAEYATRQRAKTYIANHDIGG